MKMVNPCIVVVAYNRPNSLRRLLSSISAANFTGFTGGIPLVISIDKGGDPDCFVVAKNFDWKFGTKEVSYSSERLGLKKHIIACGDLTDQHESVIILEDDLYVARCFYKYAVAALAQYESDDRIAGISLYNYQLNEINSLPFKPVKDGYDNYFIQFASSWGQAWSKGQWNKFRLWFSTKKDNDLFVYSIPQEVKHWSTSSWKKFYIAYLQDTNRYFVFPRVSYSTNFADVGTHLKSALSLYQTTLAAGFVQMRFSKLEESLAIYDPFFELAPACLAKLTKKKPSQEAFCLDLYGLKKEADFTASMVFTCRPRDKKKCLRAYAGNLEPPELNIAELISGEEIFYTDIGNIDFGDTKSAFVLYSRLYRIESFKVVRQLLWDFIKRKLNFIFLR